LVEAIAHESKSSNWLDLSARQHIELGKRLREKQFQVTQTMMDSGNYEQALPLLEELSDLTPRNGAYRRALFQCQQEIGLFVEASNTLNQLESCDIETISPEQLAVVRNGVLSGNRCIDASFQEAVDRRKALRRARRVYHLTLSTARSDRFGAECFSGLEFTIVTGLPRSGTSLMMQMIRRGGMEVLTDNQPGDDGNPGGYLEEKRLFSFMYHPCLLEQIGSSAVKLFCHMVQFLPVSHRYNLIFMIRPTKEVAVSRQRNRERHRDPRRTLLPAHLSAHDLERLRDRIRAKLADCPQVRVLDVDYPCLVRNPNAQVSRLVDFLGVNRLPHADQMGGVVAPQLYRNRAATDAAVE
jgi:hypothetical protein